MIGRVPLLWDGQARGLCTIPLFYLLPSLRGCYLATLAIGHYWVVEGQGGAHDSSLFLQVKLDALTTARVRTIVGSIIPCFVSFWLHYC